MQTKKLMQWSTVASFTLLVVYFFLISSILPQKKYTLVKKSVLTNLYEDKKIYRTVNAKEIKVALAKSKNNKLIVNIYPIKLSNNPTKADFDLTIIFQDVTEAKKNLGNKINLNVFKKQAAWYIAYLKSKQILKEQIPYGYYIELNPALIQNAVGLNISVIAEKAKISYYNVIEETKKNGSAVKYLTEGFSKYQVQIFSDSSAGKCPPCMIPVPLLLQDVMKTLITEEYNKSI